ncbi:uncharacterized protein LOC143279337 [Babylonia areolata]|uniref:uncharacterized protein LOC143279337 n=1 Tax=Babylonia areolata TaxID=304850 RepID=UPI003FD340E5
MNALELENKGLTARESVLRAQKDSLQQEHLELQQQLTLLEEDVEREMVAFCQNVEAHSEVLDLSASGQWARQNKASSTLERLLATEQTILKDIAEYETHRETISQLQADTCCQQQSLYEAEQTKKELEECMATEQETLQQLEEQKQEVSKTPQCGEEFKRLRGELASLHTGLMEQECTQLQQQVHALQQQLYSRQQQQLRRQQLCQPQQQLPAQEPRCHGNEESSAVRPCGRDDDGNTPLSRDHVSTRHDVTDDDDDMTLPDLELLEAERQIAGNEGLRVCNRQKPVFKPLHC